MSAIDPETIDVTQPPPINPTTSGLRAVVAAIKALFVTAKGEVEDLDGRVTALEAGGGGGGDAWVETRATFPAPGQGSLLHVDHPALPLAGFGPRVEAEATLPGASRSVSSANNEASDWEPIRFLDLPAPPAPQEVRWTLDAPGQGHLSTAQGRLTKGCTIRIGGADYTVTDLGDQTAQGGITLADTGSPATDSLLEGYWGALAGYSGSLGLSSGGGFYASNYNYPAKMVVPFDCSAVESWTGVPYCNAYLPSQFNYITALFSKDGGQTWWGFTGAAWVQCDPTDEEDWNSRACVVKAYDYLWGANLQALTLQQWTDFVGDATQLEFCVAVWTSSFQYSPTFYGFTWYYQEKDFDVPRMALQPPSHYGGSGSLTVKRISESRLELKQDFGTINELRVRVFTPRQP